MPIPNACIFSGAKKGRTICCCSSDLHLTTVGGHTGLGQGAGGEHFVGGGHLTSGQRGLGHGGHSPALYLHILLSMMTGCGFGMLLFSTYLLRSGTGGHSVFSIYCDISGEVLQGGTCDFRIYLLRSGSTVRGHGAIGGGIGHLGAGFLHPHDPLAPHDSQTGELPVNPS